MPTGGERGRRDDVAIEDDRVHADVLIEDALEGVLVRRRPDDLETLGLEQVVKRARRLGLGNDHAHDANLPAVT
jgi:hypothetical protein